jgi:multiple sugar transport system permease protein
MATIDMNRELITFLKHFLMVFLAIAMVLPFLWMLGASIKPNVEIERLSLLPEEAHYENFGIVLRLVPEPRSGKLLDLNFPKWYFNSFFVAAWVTTLQVMTSALAAFAFARLQWRGRDTVFLLYLGTMMIPSLILMLPNYQIMVKLGLVNTYTGLILPMAFTAFGTFLMRQFMITLPRSYDEAAEIDGATPLQVFLDVILPLSRPGLVTLAILTFLGNFQSFFWPLVMVKDEYLRTIPIGLLSFQTDFGQQTELIMAATVMNIVPLIVLFIVMQKQLVAGIQIGGVKG